MSQNTNGVAKTSERLLSLDFFRGLTIAGMILVNNPGSWSYIYPPLEHAEWNGWTPTDLIFPFFLFIVGTSMAYSFAKRLEKGDKFWDMFKKVITRSLILFGLGLFLAFFPRAIMNKVLFDKFDLVNLRIPGVLQRIALCFFFGSLIILKLKEKWQYIVTGALMIVYWLGMLLICVPGYGAGDFSLQGNVCGYLDKIVFGPTHLYIKNAVKNLYFDPEGFWSTLPAIATTMFGYFTGQWLRSKDSAEDKTLRLFINGNVFIVFGAVLGLFIPINKQLWTPSYAVLMSGMAMVFLAMSYYLVDVKKFRFGVMPMVWLGTNAITAFVGSGLLARVFIYFIKLPLEAGKDPVGLNTVIYKTLLVPWAGNHFGSLVWALLNVAVWIGLMKLLYDRKIFIKV
ncbi:MAG: DUF5009 domain-containing protein [Elusimicrobiota bacterium]